MIEFFTFEKWHQSPPTSDGTLPVELSQCKFHVEQRYTADH